MNVKERVRTELDRLASQFSTAPHSTSLQLADGNFQANITQLDGLACAFESFTYSSNTLADASIEQLKEIADDLSKQLCYLLESISPIEIDDEACVVQMRSNPPQRDDDGTCYYELLVARGELSLCRYRRTSGQPRSVVQAQVTREVFERLVEDFVGSAE